MHVISVLVDLYCSVFIGWGIAKIKNLIKNKIQCKCHAGDSKLSGDCYSAGKLPGWGGGGYN